MIESDCARSLLEIAPRIVHFIRGQVRETSELTVPQFRVLARLYKAPATNRELAERQGISPPTMCRIVNGLVQRKLVKRDRVDSNDRRQVQLHLTSKGRRSFEKIMKVTHGKLLPQIHSLSPTEKSQLKDSLIALARLFP